jgi:hypothetical protein
MTNEVHLKCPEAGCEYTTEIFLEEGIDYNDFEPKPNCPTHEVNLVINE